MPDGGVQQHLQGEGEIDIAKIIQINIKTHFAEGDVNVYVILGDPVTLVDTGLPTEESVQQLRDGLAAVGLSFSDVGQIIVTHMHLDHCGGVMAIQSEADVPVFVHERAKTVLTGGRREFDRTEAFMQAFVSQCGAVGLLNRSRQYREEVWKHIRYLKNGDTVLAGSDRFHVLEVPGHSQTDLCLWSPGTGDVFVGDYLLQKISANAFISPPEPGDRERPKPLLQLRDSLNRARDLPWKMIYPGHGDPYLGHRQVINQRFLEQHERCEQIRRLLQAGPRTVYELSCAMFPWLKAGAVFLGLSEIQGHLDLLESRGLVAAAQQGDVILYRACEGQGSAKRHCDNLSGG
ncbi:MBL fold metallo-hydrolase [Brevibacillus sp. B_LB10_24]|uniref:MBL fold metallo-hydrolase n=1 Tax=Brevibacillus sp. B_LB10_24 TaxID=3380645 RepID=UPI0038BA949A